MHPILVYPIFVHFQAMKKTILGLSLLFSVLLAGAQTAFTEAKATAKTTHKYILLNFSGSDWCIPCIKMEKEVFEKQAFHQFAAERLVLVNADFPRNKKNQPPKEKAKENEALAEQYNSSGTFPLTLLLDANGRVVKEWPGNPEVSAEVFVQQVAAAIAANGQ